MKLYFGLTKIRVENGEDVLCVVYLTKRNFITCPLIFQKSSVMFSSYDMSILFCYYFLSGFLFVTPTAIKKGFFGETISINTDIWYYTFKELRAKIERERIRFVGVVFTIEKEISGTDCLIL